MIIIPDTHGLDFWKDAVSKRQDNEKKIFLGDYLDPHGGKINKAAFEQCFDNLCQILEFKKVNEKSCILLFGNHELSYLFGWWATRYMILQQTDLLYFISCIKEWFCNLEPF